MTTVQFEIHSSPTRFVQPWKLKNGVPVMIRAIRPSDEPLLARFHEKLSDRTVYFRYFGFIKLGYRIAHEQLARTCLTNDRDFALVAVLEREPSGEQEIIGIGQISKQDGSGESSEAECALMVRDDYQDQGLGRRLCECLLEISRALGAQRAVSMILPQNYAMHVIARRLGFSLELNVEDHIVWATLVL